MAKCLVTGSHGFIGTVLCNTLENQGHEVIRLPRSWVATDIPKNIEYIFHLASYGNMYYQQDRNQTFNANVVNTFNLLEDTKDINYKKFVFVSTSSVLLPKQTLYSSSKLSVEALLESYDKPIAIIRPYSVTGVGEQEAHLIPKLIDAAFTGNPIPFTPEPTHDYIDVKDLVNGMINVAFEEHMQGMVFSLGSTKSYTNQEVLELVEEITGKTIDVQIIRNLRPYDTTDWVSHQNWSTRTLKETIREMVEDYEQKT